MIAINVWIAISEIISNYVGLFFLLPPPHFVLPVLVGSVRRKAMETPLLCSTIMFLIVVVDCYPGFADAGEF
jgi:hypothetical protein